jgi:hypothetical protein
MRVGHHGENGGKVPPELEYYILVRENKTEAAERRSLPIMRGVPVRVYLHAGSVRVYKPRLGANDEIGTDSQDPATYLRPVRMLHFQKDRQVRLPMVSFLFNLLIFKSRLRRWSTLQVRHRHNRRIECLEFVLFDREHLESWTADEAHLRITIEATRFIHGSIPCNRAVLHPLFLIP